MANLACSKLTKDAVYCCFTAALLLLYCCFTAALLLLYYCCTACNLACSKLAKGEFVSAVVKQQ
jgi:hypothetical protein